MSPVFVKLSRWRGNIVVVRLAGADTGLSSDDSNSGVFSITTFPELGVDVFFEKAGLRWKCGFANFVFGVSMGGKSFSLRAPVASGVLLGTAGATYTSDESGLAVGVLVAVGV